MWRTNGYYMYLYIYGIIISNEDICVNNKRR